MYWGEVKGILANIKNRLTSEQFSQESIDNLCLLAASALSDSAEYRAGLSAILNAEALILSKLLPAPDVFTHVKVYDTVVLIHKQLISKHYDAIYKKWNTFVKEQLSQGGAKLFKYISKWEKRFLNVSWETHGDGATGPSQFLDKQVQRWSKLWNPDDPALKESLV